MTKNGSIFKVIQTYFKKKPISIIAWLWVSLMPILGSTILILNYETISNWKLGSVLDYTIYTLLTALLMGLALLPTTLTALASGFFIGWMGLPFLILAYSIASVIGYFLGLQSNSGLLEILFTKNPKLKSELDSRKGKEGSLVFFVRISPVIPFAISSFIFASMQISLRKVLIYGIPGMLPRTLISFGTGVLASSFLLAQKSLSSPMQWGIGAILLIFGVLGIYNYLKKQS
jgi:uncharacterized membrane protein YdjX (TVP38/TMEM64 family)